MGKEITPHGSLMTLTNSPMGKTKEEELLDKINKLQDQVDSLAQKKVELEDYID